MISLLFCCPSSNFSSYLFISDIYSASSSSPELLQLKGPKLIVSNASQNALKLEPIIQLNDTIIKTHNEAVDFSNKLNKKNKNYIKSENVADVKKAKVKATKKNRRSVDLDNDDLLISKRKGVINDDNLSLDVVKKPKLKKKSKVTDNQILINVESHDRSHHTQDCKQVVINQPITIENLATKLNMPATEIIMYLFLKGISVTINQVVDVSIAKDIANSYEVQVVETLENTSNFLSTRHQKDNINISEDIIFTRPPIVTIFGHVDHGKTTLLDAILNTKLVEQEYGGITQAINGYEIEAIYNDSKYKLVFVDTPGHNAFTSMRSRGAEITDLALLIVAADDGLKPQTIECIKSIFERNLPYIVVINKIDKVNIDIQRLKEQLAEYNILDESWGGTSTIIEVSALEKINIDILLSKICQLSNSLNLIAQLEQYAQGIVLESYIDKKRGVVANVVVQNGNLKIGDFFVASNIYCKVKSLSNSFGYSLQKALPSSIVQMLGFSSLPKAGSLFQCVASEKEAKINSLNNLQIPGMGKKEVNNSFSLLNKRVTLDSYANKTDIKQINLILKTDTQGSIEAILNTFYQISQQKVQINILIANSGNITNSDIDLARASGALIVGFNIDVSLKTHQLSKKVNLSIHVFNVIYDICDFVQEQMLNLIDPEYDKIFLGKAIVQTVFNINRGTVAGCLVERGKLKKGCHISIFRSNDLIYQGIIDSLKQVKDDVDEVIVGHECGVMSIGYRLWKKQDIIEAYNLTEKRKTL